MKVIAFNGSPRKDGNTAIMIRKVFAELEAQGIETELIQLAGQPLRGCIACYQCVKNQDKKCAVKSDKLNGYIDAMLDADGIIFGSPVYFADITAELKALIDRAGFVARTNGDLFKRKVGAGVVAARRGGAIHAFDSINHFFLVNQMLIPGSCYWNFGFGRDIGEIEQDEEGMKTMQVLGENMAWLLKKTQG